MQEIDDGPYEPIDRATEPQRWMHDVYIADYAIVTQFDDGAIPWPERGWRPSCSASQPSVVGMLAALNVQPGQRVLEIGTGTGYNAALLAELVGRLPYAWFTQTRSGGVILAPVRAELASGPLVRLQVSSEGTARGQALRMRVGFMELRAQRTPGASWSALRWDDPTVESALTEVDPFTALLDEASRWRIAISVPSCRYGLEKRTRERGHGVAWLLDPITGSWASIVPTTPRSENYLARQAGPRRLWDETATAYRWWAQRGQPPIEAWQWTVTPHRQQISLT